MHKTEFKFKHEELEINISGAFGHVDEIRSRINSYLKDLEEEESIEDSEVVKIAGKIVHYLHIRHFASAKKIFLSHPSEPPVEDLEELFEEMKGKPYISGKTWTLKIAKYLTRNRHD